MNDIEIRQEIARLLTHRCNNCYRRLPGAVGCNVHSSGWNWVTSNFGPFCDDCFAELSPYRGATPETLGEALRAASAYYYDDAGSMPPERPGARKLYLAVHELRDWVITREAIRNLHS